MKEFVVKSWNNGKYLKSGLGYGIRIAKGDRYLFENLKKITITVDNEKITFDISESFWKNCSEFRSKKIGCWIIKNNNGELRWTEGPLEFKLIQTDISQFKLDTIE